jgi:small subunit ribosomal protein S16
LLRIRLTRVGKKKQPAYRLIVTDSRSPRDGAFLKIIGHYNPRTEPVTLVVQEEEAVQWLEKGAQPSETAAKLLTRIGVMERAGRPPVKYVGKDVPAAPKKEPKAAEEPKAAPPAAAAKTEEPAPAESEAEAAAEPQEEAPEAPPQPEPEAKEAEPEPEPEPEATSEEQTQEQAETQE